MSERPADPGVHEDRLTQAFPLAPKARGLRLYPGVKGELWVYWRLSADLLLPYRPWFPAPDGPAGVLVRLLRLVADRAPEPLAERRVALRGPRGEGRARFEVGDEPGPFQAELGLINPQGGWLALARSNRLHNAGSVGLEGLRQPPADEADLDGVLFGEGLGQGPAGVKQALSHQPKTGDIQVQAADKDSLTISGYGGPPQAAPCLVIETELRIWGWGPPNTEIDLFGHPYRIGPGGRFQLSIRLDDPELIRQLLAHQTLPGGWR